MYLDRTAWHFGLNANAAHTIERYSQRAVFQINVQPATAEATVMINGQYGQVFTGFTTYSGLLIDDEVTLSGTPTISGSRFRVKGVQDFNYGPLPHFEVTLTKPEV